MHIAFDFGAKKSGHNINRSTEEKITDAGREAYEKLTGYVPVEDLHSLVHPWT